MSKYILLFLFFTGTFNSFSQQNTFQGTYKSGGKTKEAAVSFLEIHYSKQGSILFYLEAWRGAPSYNSGAMSGQLTLNSKTGHLQYFPSDTTSDCTLDFMKKGNKITVTTIKGDCPFGYGVYADGYYSLTNKANPLFFVDRSGEKFYFDKILSKKDTL